MKTVMAEAAASQIKPAKSKEPLRTPSKSQLVPQSPPSQTATKASLISSPPRPSTGGRASSYPGSPPSSFPPLTPQRQKEPVRPQVNVTPTKQSSSSMNVLGGGSVMGPTITPVRMSMGSSKSGQRNVSYVFLFFFLYVCISFIFDLV